MRKPLAGLGLILVLVMSLFLGPSAAFADAQISIKATAGYDNKIKYGKGVPITLTLENQGDDFTGDLVIDTPESYEVGTARALPITLASGETKTIHLSLSSLAEDFMYTGTNTQLFFLYEDGWKDGKEISFKGDKTLRPSYFADDSFFMFTLTESADRLGSLRSVKLQQGMNNEIIALNQLKNNQPLPSTKEDWEMANVLLIDEYSIADWPEAQQQALLDWVKDGGIVIAGATDKGVAEFGALTEFLPLEVSNDTTTVSVEAAKSFAKTEDLTKPITIQKATVKDGSTSVWNVESTPVVAMKRVNEGAIIQTAFSLGDQPLASEKGYDELLSVLFNQSKLVSMPTNVYYGNSGYETLGYDTVYMNELFPSFQVSTGGIALIIFVYFLLVGPLLYFVLKRKDKREHAWWIIPTIAIVTSIAIFAYGARDRLLKPQVQQLSFYEVADDGSMSGYYVETLLSNRSGEFTLEADQGTTMSTWKNSSFSGISTNTRTESILENEADKPALTLRNVGYWSTSTVVGESKIPSLGKLNIKIENNSDTISGTIENTFPFALKNVQIWTGAQKIDLGDIDAGATIDVNAKFKGGIMLPAKGSQNYGGGYGYGGPVQSAAQLPEERHKALVAAYSNMMSMNEKTTPLIVATASEPIVPIQIQDERAEMDAINLIIQPFESETLVQGTFTLPSAMLDVSLYSDSAYASLDDPMNNMWYIENGEFDFDVTLPEKIVEGDISWKELKIRNQNRTVLTLELYNQKTKEYTELTETSTVVKENVADYIDETGMIKLRLIKQSNAMNDMMKLPTIELIGEVAP